MTRHGAYQGPLCQQTSFRSLADAVVGADIFLGLSTAGCSSRRWSRTMAMTSADLCPSNPTPEILPDAGESGRRMPSSPPAVPTIRNQVNNVLCFPFIFRGALDAAPDQDQ